MTSSLRPNPSEAARTENEIIAKPANAIWRRPIASSLLLGLLGLVVSFLGVWIPSPWLDEAATAHIIGYSLGDMAELWRHIDGVFGPYYVFMHFWAKLTEITPFWLRFPSLLAVGVGTAAMAAAGRAVGGWKAQLAYALCFALLPRTTAMAIEARPYAMSAMFTALALLSVVKLRASKSAWYCVALGLSMIGAVGTHLFSALPLLGLITVAVIVLPNRSRIALVVTSALAGLACLPLCILAVQQRHQVGWIATAPFNLTDQVLVEAWFTSRVDPNPSGPFVPLHYVAVVLSILAALTVILALFARRSSLPKTRLAIAAVPLVLAVGVLWGESVIHEPVLMGRYFTSSAPFFAMLVAECLLLLRPYAKQILASLLAFGCVALIISQREPYAKIPWNDFSFVASTVDTQANSGDGLLIETSPVPTDTARSAVDLYPHAFSGLVDIAQPQRAPLTHPISVDPPRVDLSTLAQLPTRIWLVSKVQQDSEYAVQLTNLGFRPASASSGPGHTVTLWVQH
ncbi:glycosyltransferase family 39 protein [Pseudarthrobacter siccitolerans]|uniref:glycosyltransferase family 39 protein n=1 Tax=Pseudarthrobacter siccitolerans TaxID=861266 RepID=UPI0027BB2161|nr:hypothetical protein [Pseudarthrobacter siccitolerans]